MIENIYILNKTRRTATAPRKQFQAISASRAAFEFKIRGANLHFRDRFRLMVRIKT